MNISGVALFMSGTLIAGALGQWPLGRASDKMDRRKVIIGACVAGALAGLAAAFLTGPGQGGILLMSFLFGAFAFPLYALCVAHTNDFVAPQEYVEAASGLLLVYGLGAVIGPTLASGLMAELGPHALFVFTAFVHATLALFALQRMWMRTRPPEKERAEFSSMLATRPSPRSTLRLRLGEGSKARYRFPAPRHHRNNPPDPIKQLSPAPCAHGADVFDRFDHSFVIRDFFLLLLAVAVFELAARQPASDCATSCRTAPVERPQTPDCVGPDRAFTA